MFVGIFPRERALRGSVAMSAAPDADRRFALAVHDNVNDYTVRHDCRCSWGGPILQSAFIKTRIRSRKGKRYFDQGRNRQDLRDVLYEEPEKRALIKLMTKSLPVDCSQFSSDRTIWVLSTRQSSNFPSCRHNSL